MRNLYQLILFLFFCLIIFPATAQNPEIQIEGYVSEARHNRPLRGVQITKDGKRVSNSISGGYFKVNITPGDSISFSLTGYQTRSIRLHQSRENLIIRLQEKPVELKTVIVRAYQSNSSILETPAATAIATDEVLHRFNNTSLVPALNTMPGVRMEERAPASYRLSIRGSTLRSPYGVRNVKVYLNDIPYTDASGVTPLNLLDIDMLSRAEVLRGPAGSLYGAGTGGTVLLKLRQPDEGEISAGMGVLAGSYGLMRTKVNGTFSESNSTSFAQYTRQQYDGYRNHSAMDRKTLMTNLQFRPSYHHSVNILAFYTDLYYQLPGGITREQYEENPQQVRPFVQQQQTAFNQKAGNIGVSNQYRWNNKWSSSLAFYGNFSSVDHPFVTDYERNTMHGFGGRGQTVFSTDFGNIAGKFTLGTELQRGFLSARNYENNRGRVDTLRFDDEISTTSSINFAQAQFTLPNNWFITAGASYALLNYDIARLTDAALQRSYFLERKFSGEFSPRLAVLKKLSDDISVFASAGRGYSPPTEAEVRTSDGSINQNLKPETGINYEAGLRGILFNSRFGFDVVAFTFQLRETIVSRTTPSGVAVFHNSGKTRQNGLETALNYQLINRPELFLSSAKVWSSYTYYHFRFKDYRQNDTDYSDNKLTGAAPHTLTAGLDLETRNGLYLYLTSNYSDEIPLNDANTVFADSYLIFGAKAGWRTHLFNKLKMELFAGIDNATDQKYSLGNDLNAFGNRYFQAAPGRNFYAGANFTFYIRKPFFIEWNLR